MNKKLLYIVIAVVVIGAAVFLVARKPTLLPTPLVQPPSSNAPAIVKAVMSRSVDAAGNATGVATTFSTKTDKIVYAVLTLKNATRNTKLSYVRYLNGKYIDSKVAQPSKDGITNFYFTFEKGIGDYPKGSYALNLYVDGKRTTTLHYTFN